MYTKSIKAAKQKKIHQKRYWAKTLRNKYDFIVDVRHREIRTEHENFEEVPIGARWYLGQLLKVGFTVQYNLFKNMKSLNY